nr:acidic 10K polypeptide [synthetic construct]
MFYFNKPTGYGSSSRRAPQTGIVDEGGDEFMCYCQDPYVKEAENLKKYFNAGHSDVADNGTLFLGILKNWKEESDRKIMQSQIVSFYFKLEENR